MEPSSPPPWLTDARAGWYAEVEAWLPAAGRGAVLAITTVKERPWSAVLRVRFERGTAYFKACGPGGSHEPALLRYLAGGWSPLLPERLQVDEARGWMLLADAGEPLRDVADADGHLAVLSRLLPAYAELQVSTVEAVEPLLRLGLPDRRLDRLPGLLAELLADGAAHPLLPEFARCCADLAASPFSAALDHGDLHPGNVLVRGDSFCLCDWGDSSITHPFASLGVTFEVCPPARQLLDAYLAPWARFGAPEALRRDFERALWVAEAVRALDMARMLAGGDEGSRARWQPFLAARLERWARYPGTR